MNSICPMNFFRTTDATDTTDTTIWKPGFSSKRNNLARHLILWFALHSFKSYIKRTLHKDDGTATKTLGSFSNDDGDGKENGT